MKSPKVVALFLAVVLVSAIVCSCSKEEKMPEVNDANCKGDIALNIKDKDIRREFTERCKAAATKKAIEGESEVHSSHKSY